MAQSLKNKQPTKQTKKGQRIARKLQKWTIPTFVIISHDLEI